MGRELRCFEDLDLFGAECASALEELEQDVVHMLIERKGSNLDDLNQGEAVDEWLSGPSTSPIGTGRIDAGIRRDPRVLDVTTTITDEASGTKAITLAIRTDDDELLALDLAVDAEGIRRIS